ncbi:hypothetical protein N7492_008117 [Penicillium capsulatum]|uniref:Uncharacterized protein n=1 Tax=Penicillium capsulatum TaxID=69766 RepID=A0A9W9HUL1_9EURO|nr:hypothetical protein N7492_008117 [Penicillium capsulatum]KAJ6105527.1 hypothetical protein N7512_009044 [Penicillium capsulatum]
MSIITYTLAYKIGKKYVLAPILSSDASDLYVPENRTAKKHEQQEMTALPTPPHQPQQQPSYQYNCPPNYQSQPSYMTGGLPYDPALQTYPHSSNDPRASYAPTHASESGYSGPAQERLGTARDMTNSQIQELE